MDVIEEKNVKVIIIIINIICYVMLVRIKIHTTRILINTLADKYLNYKIILRSS